MPTKEEFIREFGFRVTGGFVHGYDAATRLSPRDLAEYQQKIVPNVKDLLAEMYDFMNKQPKGTTK